MAKVASMVVHGIWASESGEYGSGSLVVLSPENVTLKNLEFLAQLPEAERFAYAVDVANGVDLTPWEVQYAGG
jgi:hypothetical protein